MSGESFALDVIFIAGGRTQLPVEDSDHVKDVKVRLKEHAASPKGPFKLLFCGAELPDDRTLYSLGVGPTEKGLPPLYCVTVADVCEETGPSRNAVKVINLSGGHVMIPASESDTVGHLKESLARSLTLPVDQMRLLHRGSELKDEDLVRELNEESVAHAPAPLYLLERPLDHVGHKVNQAVEVAADRSMHSRDLAAIPSGALIERKIDNDWFPAKVFRMHVAHEAQKVDIKYLDDGNIELGVDWAECRWLERG